MKVGFAGLSHLGLVSGICVASKGFELVGYDPDVALIDRLNKKQLPIYEPELDQLMSDSWPRIQFTHELNKLKTCDVVYVSLDVKTNADNSSDLGPLRSLIDQVKNNVKSGATLVVLSQVPPGFSRKLMMPKEIQFYYQVETLIFGRAVERSLRPERYMVGCSDPKKSLPPNYEALLKKFDCPILTMQYESAELCKISINMFLAASVTVTNTLAEICENIGAIWSEISPALKLDKRIGQYAYLSPGLGLAGGNIERDIATIKNLSMEYGTEGSVAESFISNSSYRKDWALRQVHSKVLSKNPEGTLAVWGIAYKQDTKSVKNSPAIQFVEGLTGIKMKMYDPQAVLPDTNKTHFVKQVSTAIEACKDAHALVIMTPWNEFSKTDLSVLKNELKGEIIIDPFEILNRNECKKLGFDYLSLGKPLEVQ